MAPPESKIVIKTEEIGNNESALNPIHLIMYHTDFKLAIMTDSITANDVASLIASFNRVNDLVLEIWYFIFL
jgi:hypothetical protein